MANNTTTGILLFKKPNKYTIQSSSPGIYSIPIKVGICSVSSDEYYAVSTRCGTDSFNQKRIDDYTDYKLQIRTIDDIIIDNFKIIDMDIFSDNREKYYQLLLKDWYGEDFLVEYYT